ncbi:hypothetical protein [Nonlabens ulvanivorans]|uniref:hypothetical protein n=1 Tax=Nonlabens ulvanivorans TaxID=906888 RepID=UPI0037CC6CD4
MLDRKNIYLLGSIILGLMICYQFTVKNTFEYKEELEAIGMDQLESKNQKLIKLAQQNRLYLKALEEKQISNISIRDALFESIEKGSSITIKNYNDQITSVSNNLKTTYHQIELEGNYADLISALDEILILSPKSKLIHFSFFKSISNFRSPQVLFVDIVIIDVSMK